MQPTNSSIAPAISTVSRSQHQKGGIFKRPRTNFCLQLRRERQIEKVAPLDTVPLSGRNVKDLYKIGASVTVENRASRTLGIEVENRSDWFG
jgi:hypothetical protein